MIIKMKNCGKKAVCFIHPIRFVPLSPTFVFTLLDISINDSCTLNYENTGELIAFHVIFNVDMRKVISTIFFFFQNHFYIFIRGGRKLYEKL